MAKGGVLSDISISDGTTEAGLTLKRLGGKPVFAQKEMEPFSFLQASGYLDEASQNPQAVYPISFQKSWAGGFGAQFLQHDQPRRYLASYGVDASEDGVLRIGPKFVAVNWPTVTAFTALADGGLETWASATDLTSWTEAKTGSASVDRESTTKRSGTYSARLIAGTGTVSINQSLSAWNNEYRGKRFTATAWVYQDTADAGRLDIYDGIGTTTGTTIATTGSWVKLTVSRVLDSAATEATVKCRSVGAAPITFFDDVTFTGYTKSTNNAYAEYNGLQYISIGDILYKANSATAPTSWTYVTSFGQDITHLFSGQVSGTAYLFIMIGSGNTNGDNGYYYDGTTLTQMTDGGGNDASGDYMITASTTFYISGRPTGVTTGAKSVMRTNTAPLAGAWSADTRVGDPNTSINSALNCNNVVYFAKEDSLWKVNTDGTVSMVVDYKVHQSSNSGKNAFSFNNKVYVPVGVNSLIEYDPDSGTWDDISPAASISSPNQAQIAMAAAVLSSSQTDFDGRILAVAGGGGGSFLWVIQDNGAQAILYKGKYAAIDGVGWHWHPVANTTLADPNFLAVSSLTTAPIIWTAPADTTQNPGYYDLAQYQTDNPGGSGSGNPYILTPFFTGGVWRMFKAVHRILLGLESITANVYITLQYRLYGGSWSSAITFDGAAGTVSDGQDSYTFDSNDNVYGTAIQFRLNFITNSATATPKVTRLNGEGVIRPAQVQYFEAVVSLADGAYQRNGARDPMPASTKLTVLNTCRAANWPQLFYDMVGTAHYVDLFLIEDAEAPQRRAVGNTTFTKRLLLKKTSVTAA